MLLLAVFLSRSLRISFGGASIFSIWRFGSGNNLIPLLANFSVLNKRDVLLNRFNQELSIAAKGQFEGLLNHIISVLILYQIEKPIRVTQSKNVIRLHLG